MQISAKWRKRHAFGLQGGADEGTSRLHLMRSGLVEVVRLGEGEPIVLVPSLAGSWRLLAPLARRLARTHEVILYSLAGDRAGAARSTSIAEYAHDLADLMGDLRLERPAVFGVSFGGAIALELATEAPQMLGSLILYGAEGRFRPGLGYTILRRVLERYPLPTDHPFFNQFFNILHGRPPESAEMADFVVRTCWQTDQVAMIHRLRAIEHFDLMDRLWRVDLPSLVLAGTLDVVVPVDHQRTLAGAISGCHFEEVAGAGHIGFLTHRGEVARQVCRMLQTVHRSVL